MKVLYKGKEEKQHITFHKLDAKDNLLIERIAGWYEEEWNIEKVKTIVRLSGHPNEDVLCQVVLSVNNIPVATGGIYNHVGLHNAHPIYKQFRPWLSLLYTVTEHRGKGLGGALLGKIQETAKEMKLPHLYLYTFSAESLYRKNGWTEIERVVYNGHDTVIMEKDI